MTSFQVKLKDEGTARNYVHFDILSRLAGIIGLKKKSVTEKLNLFDSNFCLDLLWPVAPKYKIEIVSLTLLMEEGKFGKGMAK